MTLTAYTADGNEYTVNGASEDEGRFIGLSVQSLANAGPGGGGSATMFICLQPEPTSS